MNGWYLIIIFVAFLLVELFVRCGGLYPHAAARVLDYAFMLPVDNTQPTTTATRKSNKRAYISPLTKKRVAAKYRWRCRLCNKLLDGTYEIDHIIPISLGGTNDENNLAPVHRSCHQVKSANEAMARVRS